MRFLIVLALACGAAQCQNLNCDLREYKPLDGLTAQVAAGNLQVRWEGERGNDLRADFTIRDAQPMVRGLAIRSGQGNWRTLASDLTPVFDVTSGRRRMSEQQLRPLRDLKLRLTLRTSSMPVTVAASDRQGVSTLQQDRSGNTA